MKILVLTKYSRMGASSRLRTLQYLPLLENNGFDFTVRSLFDDIYLENLYNNKGSSKLTIINYYLKRLITLTQASKYDVIWIEYEAFPYFPAFAESLLAFIGADYIVDYDDAVFHNYDLSDNKFVRFFLSKKIDKVMKNASYVLTGNNYLAERARLAGAKKVQILPTVVDHIKYKKCKKLVNKVLTIGWIGSPSTQKYIIEILSELIIAYQQIPFRLLLIGATQGIGKDLEGLDVEIHEWDETIEADMISLMDIGIMPLNDGPWEKGKCGYKLIQYMACGVPIIASDVGVNSDIVESTNAGLIVKKDEFWSNKLIQLLNSSELREQYGRFGKEAVEKKYSIQSQLPILTSVLTSVVK